MTSSRIAPVGDQGAERTGRRDGHGRVVRGRQRLERRAAALDVEGRHAVDEDDVRAGGALERPAVVVAATRPGERGAVRVGRIGGGQEVDRRRSRAGSAASRTARSRSTAPGQRELGRAEPVDEVAAPDPAGLLQRPQDRVDGGEPAVDPLGRDRLAGQDAVPLEQGEALGVEPLPWRRLRHRDRVGCDERPAAGRLGRPERGQPARAAARRRRAARGPLPAQGAQRRERVVRDLAGPDQVPQRVEHLAVRGPAAAANSSR